MAQMASLPSKIVLFAVLVSLCSWAEVNAESRVVATARKDDIKYIRCGVCEAIGKQLSRQVREKRDKLAPKKLTELQIIDMAENICNMKKEESDWILKLDIVEKGDKLQLVEQPQEGICKTECKTIERACQEVMGDHDTDVAEYLYKEGSNRAGLINLLCKDLTNACVGKVPRVPKDREPGEAFTAKSGKEAEMEKLMRSMNDMPGAPGMKMYSRDELVNNPGLMGGGQSPTEDDDTDDEDEDEDEDVVEKHLKSKTPVKGAPPSGSGSILEKLIDAVGKFGTELAVESSKLLKIVQQQVDRTAKQFGAWWSGKKPTTRASSQSKSKPKSKSASSSGEL